MFNTCIVLPWTGGLGEQEWNWIKKQEQGWQRSEYEKSSKIKTSVNKLVPDTNVIDSIVFGNFMFAFDKVFT